MSTLLSANKLACVRNDKCIFDDISFELGANNLLLIEGPNGSGKSSLLRILAGIATPYSGEVRCANKESLHYVGHMNGLKLGLTVAENLQLIHASEKNLAALLVDLQLSEYKNTVVKHLSAGQKRRVALARLFLSPKMIWLLDEPLTALDANTQIFFISKLEEHLSLGGIAVISSHHALPLQFPHQSTIRLGTC
jgi:heme exporter protein A